MTESPSKVGWEEFVFLASELKNVILQMGMLSPTPPQLAASPLIAEGENVLLVAPTGSGKTEAAVLPILNRLLGKRRGDGILLLYITPMRALNRDMLKRLAELCMKLGFTVQVRHGDTPKAERNKQGASPPDILITTPETLQAILPGRRMRKNLSTLSAVIVDELHELIESKRGVQLTVALQRLKELASFQLVALSATIGNLDRAAEFIFGDDNYRIIRSDASKQYRFIAKLPMPDEDIHTISESTFSPPDLAARLAFIDRMIEAHESTLIFVNSRTIAEMLGEKLSRLRGDVGVHHGSLPREERERVEQAFKDGKLKALVCTSTMELGIDVGRVDLVLQYMSPRQVSSLLQRVGRSGHSLKRVSDGTIIAVSAEDLLESCAAIGEAQNGRLEEMQIYEEALDVLAHQIAGYLMDFGSMSADAIIAKIRRAPPYRNLREEEFWSVVNYLEGLRKLKVERIEGSSIIHPTRGTREYYFQNLSMIPDEVRYMVVDAATNERIGILGEEFVLLHAKVGLHIILKGRVWQIEKIAEDRKIYVTSVEDPLAAVPGWDGELLPLPYSLAQETGRLRRIVAERIKEFGPEKAVSSLSSELPSDLESIARAVEEIDQHIRMGAPLPCDDTIVVEGFERYLILHMCFGERVNRLFALSFEELLSRKGLVRLWWMDGYRVLFELTADTEELGINSLAEELFSIKPEEVEQLYRVAAQRNFPFPERVKAVAERFGAVKRGQYISHPNLCSLPTRFESTPIYVEATRETSKDKIDMERAKKILEDISSSRIKVQAYQSEQRPTPIAYHMLYRYLEFPESVAPDSLAKSTVQRIKLLTTTTSLRLLCMKCSFVSELTTIGKADEEPRCDRCGSGLLSPLFWENGDERQLVKRKLEGETLAKEEVEKLARLRRAADLVLSYGKRALIALSIYGIGPQTASRILAKMPEDEEEFYRMLLDAKLKFIATRPYWQD